MANNKTPDNIIQFPKKYRRPTTPEQDKVMADRIKKELAHFGLPYYNQSNNILEFNLDKFEDYLHRIKNCF